MEVVIDASAAAALVIVTARGSPAAAAAAAAAAAGADTGPVGSERLCRGLRNERLGLGNGIMSLREVSLGFACT